MDESDQNLPSAAEGDQIKIGNIAAIITDIRAFGDIEVVYLDRKNLALAEDAVWRDGAWAFKTPGGAVARLVDRKASMKPFIDQLRALHKPDILSFPGKRKK